MKLQVRDIGSGNFGIARLMRDRTTGELIAVKYIERGDKVILASCYMSISSFTRFLFQLPAAQWPLNARICLLIWRKIDIHLPAKVAWACDMCISKRIVCLALTAVNGRNLLLVDTSKHRANQALFAD